MHTMRRTPEPRLPAPANKPLRLILKLFIEGRRQNPAHFVFETCRFRF